jgi:hypothetical protein
MAKRHLYRAETRKCATGAGFALLRRTSLHEGKSASFYQDRRPPSQLTSGRPGSLILSACASKPIAFFLVPRLRHAALVR